MDVAPPRLRSDPQRDRDRVVCLLIMGTGVLVGGIIGAGHPTTRQAQPQLGPGIPAGQALQAARRVRLDGVGPSNMPTLVPVGTACTTAASSRHQTSSRRSTTAGCRHNESTASGDPGKQAKQARPITWADSRAVRTGIAPPGNRGFTSNLGNSSARVDPVQCRAEPFTRRAGAE
jgi:hypothetical protein